MYTMPAPTVRLLLLKSGAGSGAKIAHQGGYAKYGTPPRWHAITAAKPAPKGAPVAAHPKAAGHHEPAAHFTDDQWAALKLPDSNVNASTFNGALAKLKAWSDAGDVTAILGAGYGVNTYGQRLVKLANHLLGLHGSPHKVVPGQKPGTHAATLNADPAAPHPTGLPDHIAPKVAEPTPPTEAAHAEGDKWVMPLDAAVAEHKELVAAAESPSKADDKAVLAEQKAELGKLEAAQAGGAGSSLAEKIEAAGFKAHFNEHGNAYVGAKNFDSPKIFINPEKAKEAVAKLKAAGLHAYQSGATVQIEAAHAAVATPAPKPSAPEITSSKNFSVGGVDFVAVKKENAKGSYWIPAIKDTGQEIDHQSYVSIKKMWDDLAHVAKITGDKFAQSIGVKAAAPVADAAPAAGPLAMPAFEEGKTTTGVVDYYTAHAQKVMNMAAAGDVAGLEKFKADGMKPNAKGKISNTWAGKTANSKKLLALHAAALAHAGGGAPAVAPEPTPAPRLVLPKKASAVPAAAPPEPDPDTITVPEKLGKVGPTTFKPAPDFKNYAEAQAWIAERAKALGMSKASFQSSYEYAHAMPKLQAAYAPAKADYDAKMADKKAEALAAMSDAGVKLGDTVAWNSVGAFLSQTKYEGTVVMHGGLPHVKLAHKTTVSKGGKLVHTNYLLWQLHMKPKGAAVAPAPKEGDTKPAADGGILVLKDGHWVKQGGDVALDAATSTQAMVEAIAQSSATPEHKKAAIDAVLKQAADTSPLSAEQLQNLQSIPWYKLKLPDSNSNAKSHNKQVEKIEAMAFAGDVAGLKAFKAGKNTYGKKQNLLAQTALGFLSGDAPTAEQKVRAAKVAAQPEPAVEAASLAGKPALEHIKTHFEPGDFGWSQKSPDSVVEAEAAKWVDQNPADAEDMVSALVDVGASDLAKKFKYSPAAAPAPEPTPKPTRLVAKPAKVKVDAPLYQNTKHGHSKFWAVSTLGPVMKTTYGKIGSTGQETVKTFASEVEAKNAAVKLMSEKQANGYVYKGEVQHEHDAPTVVGAGAPAAATPDTGPKEGDTKQGADGMLVLKNGHWVKVGGDQPSAKAIVATVPMPKLGGGTGKVKYTQKMKELKAIAEQEGAAGLSKVVSFSPSGHVKIKGYKLINPNGSVYGKNADTMAQYAKALHDAVVGAGAVGTPAAAPAPATPTPPPTVNGLPSMDNWVQTGQQGGSNPGGKFKDPSGQEWYCKWPDDAEAAKSEVLAAKLYALAGLSAQDCMLVSKGGKTAIATKWVNIQKAPSPSALAAADGALAGFAVDAWLGNWDVVGLAFDNLQIGPDGKAHRVDAGGSLEYRAQGEKKPFGPKVDELDTLRDAGKNAQAAAVFKGMTKADMTASAAKVLAISDVAIRAMVNQYGPGDATAKAKLAETLIARKKDIAAKFPEAAKKKKAPTFKPEDISAPPSFLNWGGSGKSGPSSKEFLNKANEDAVQAIFAAAKTGDAEAVKKLTAPVFDKGTGAVTGQQSVLYHPSQHVSGYAQQAINEINYQLNPPKQFRFDGGHPLHSLNAAYPSHKGAPSSAAAQKLGKFIALGEPGVIALADLALPAKITHAEGGGTLSVHTYAKQAQAAIAKMPATQKQAIKSYTGSSYHAMNGSLWDGNPTGAAKAAGEALKTLGHDIEPGTILSRQMSLHGQDLNDILGSVGKVLQEPAIMSTSIRPSSWVRNVQFKLHVGPGVKGLWVGHNSLPGGGALSINSGEDEMVLPPGTRLLVLNVRKGGKDADGFGAHGQQHVIEAIILPTE